MAYDLTRKDITVFDDLFDSMMSWNRKSPKVPPVDIEESADNFMIKAEMPGFNEDNVKIYVEKHVLHINGTVDESKKSETKGSKIIVKERREESFSRTFSLPEGLDEAGIEADFENGILTVTLPKLPAEKPRQIEIKIGKK